MDGDGVPSQMEFYVLMFQLSLELKEQSRAWFEEIVEGTFRRKNDEFTGCLKRLSQLQHRPQIASRKSMDSKTDLHRSSSWSLQSPTQDTC
ncbi:EF-hand domain-containing protein [Psidium guajava]|nr:EF-hand domain-containing protein [Psidium guajava]